jgi:DNA polymerase-3 subunit alpha
MRVDSRDLNRRVLESLIQCGALDPLGDRHALLRQLDSAMDHAAAVRRERDLGQTSLFGDAVDILGTLVPHLTAPGEAGEPGHGDESWLAWERELLGMYLSDHPLRRIADELRTRVDTGIADLGPHLDGLQVQVGGSVREVRTVIPRRSTTGQRMAFLQIEDLSGSCEVVVFARTFEECQQVLRPDEVVVVRGKVEAQQQRIAGVEVDDDREGETVKIIAESVFALNDPRLQSWRANQTVYLTVDHLPAERMTALRQAIDAHPGDTPVIVHVEHATKVDEVSLAEQYGVDPSPALERTVEALLGAGAYRVEIRRTRAAAREPRRGVPSGNGVPSPLAVRGR